MADEQHEDHWQPGQPWKARSTAEPSPGVPPREVVATVDPAKEHPDDAPGDSDSEDRRYGDAATRMMTPPPQVKPEEDLPAPADRTAMMPVVTPSQVQAGVPAAPSPLQPPHRSGGGSVPPVRDTPTSPTPPKKKAGRRRGRFLRRLLLLLFVLVAIAALGLVWVESQLSRVETPSIAGGPGPETYLIVGSDSRENLPDDLEGRFGTFEGQRADVIILAHVSGGTVQMLSLPRDLKVGVPGQGTDKINAAYAYGGGDLLAATIQEDLGIPIHQYLEVEFGGFASIVDAVGGVELTFDHPTRDLKSGLDVEAGTQVIDGATALAYVRSRSTEELRDGDWRGTDGGDVVRTSRQREVLEAVIGKALSPAGVIRVPGLVPAVTSAIRVGDSTHSWNLGFFGARFVLASESESMALPVVISTEGGVSYVVRTEEAGPAIAAFVSGDPLPLPEPAE